MERNFKLLLFVSILLSGIYFNSYSQCKSFAKKICKLELIPYIHDGNYHAAILTEGEEAELYKTFYAGQNYRMAICGSEDLGQIEFQVIDSHKNILFTNKDTKSRIWDFKLESTQQFKIVVKVPVTSNPSTDIPKSGCVAIMFGFKE